ncbi:MAG: DUF885 domain-containing protein [Halioglobus sp.]
MSFSACDSGGSVTPSAPSEIEVFADEYVSATFERYPGWATYLAIEGTDHGQLEDNSLAALLQWQAQEDTWLDRLKAIASPQDIGSRDWITYGILREKIESDVAMRVCRNELWQASTETSWHRGLPFVFQVQPVETAIERQQVLNRLGKVAAFIDTEISNLKRGLELGYSAPRVTVEKVPQQVRLLIAEDSIFLNPATRTQDEDFKVAVGEIYTQEISPALLRYADFIDNQYLTAASEELTISSNPNGGLCYPQLVRSFSTIAPGAGSIHELGLQQVESIRQEMKFVVDEHFGGGTIEDFLRRVNSDPQFTFGSESEVLEYSVSALDKAKAAMPSVFGRLPIADVEIHPYPEFAESGTGEYRPPALDGSRPGVFYIAVTDPEHRSKSPQRSTLYHETYPGHHLQTALSLEDGDRVHPAARYFWNSGFAEGWGLYAERLADELGLYSNPIDYFGMLSNQSARAARLVVDTGLHTKGWSRQQAIDYMLSNTAWPETDIQNDVDRYISWPGQANAYMLGMLEIKKLRALSEEELGENFDLKAFHDRVLGFGNLTLPMLESSILSWIEERKNAR